jgi:hypothetical protein
MTTFMYIVNLILGILFAIPFLGTLKQKAGFTMSLQDLLSGYDHTVIRELFNETSVYLGPFVRQGLWIAILFFIISIFLTGGILHIFSDKSYPFTFERFFSGSLNFFFRFLKLSFYMLIIYVLVTAIIFLIVFLISAAAFSGTGSEKTIVSIALPGLCFWLLVMIFFLIIADYTRFSIVRNDSRSVFITIFRSMKFVARKFPFTYGLYLMLLIAPVILIYVYTLLSNGFGMTSGITILVMFLIQQLFIWAKTFTRIWTFASQFDYYQARPF